MSFFVPLDLSGAAAAAALSSGTIATRHGLVGAVIRLVGMVLMTQVITNSLPIKSVTLAAGTLVDGSVVHHAISKGDAEAKMDIGKNGIQASASTHRPNR